MNNLENKKENREYFIGESVENKFIYGILLLRFSVV